MRAQLVDRPPAPQAGAADSTGRVRPLRAARATLPTAAESVVRVAGVSKRFALRRGWVNTLLHPLQRRYKQVLDDVSLEVFAGELFALLGPNGAGKTTLFKILSGSVLADSGCTYVCGHDVERELSAARACLTPVIGDERSLMWRLSARENLRLFASLQNLRGRARDARVDEVLEVVELADTGTQMVAQFSSGMKQRLLIARALLVRPALLLLDEPTRSLDPVSAGRFRDFLRTEIVARQGCTVLLATHNAEEALELSTRVGILDRGRLLRTGSPAALVAEVQDYQYELTVDAAGWARLNGIAAAIATDEPDPDDPDWRRIRVNLPGGAREAAQLVDRLVHAGVQVARVTAARLSLAELIERTVAAGTARGDDA